MNKKQLRQQVTQILEKKGYEVKLDTDFKGVPLDIYAERKNSDEKLYMYVIEDSIASIAHVVNLDGIRDYNKKKKIEGCVYVIMSPNGATLTANKISKGEEIPIYKKLNNFSTYLNPRKKTAR